MTIFIKWRSIGWVVGRLAEIGSFASGPAVVPFPVNVPL